MNAEQKRRLRQKIDAGVRAAVAAALEEHRRAGRRVAILRSGRVVLAMPEISEFSDALVMREEPPAD